MNNLITLSAGEIELEQGQPTSVNGVDMLVTNVNPQSIVVRPPKDIVYIVKGAPFKMHKMLSNGDIVLRPTNKRITLKKESRHFLSGILEEDARILVAGMRQNRGFHLATEWYLRGWLPLPYQWKFHHLNQLNTTFLAGIASLFDSSLNQIKRIKNSFR